MCFQLEGRLCPCCAQSLPVAPPSLGEPEVLSKSYRPSGTRPLSLPAPPFGLVSHSSPLVPAALAARTPCCSSNTASTRPAQGLRTCRFCSHVSSRLRTLITPQPSYLRGDLRTSDLKSRLANSSSSPLFLLCFFFLNAFHDPT